MVSVAKSVNLLRDLKEKRYRKRSEYILFWMPFLLYWNDHICVREVIFFLKNQWFAFKFVLDMIQIASPTLNRDSNYIASWVNRGMPTEFMKQSYIAHTSEEENIFHVCLHTSGQESLGVLPIDNKHIQGSWVGLESFAVHISDSWNA